MLSGNYALLLLHCLYFVTCLLNCCFLKYYSFPSVNLPPPSPPHPPPPPPFFFCVCCCCSCCQFAICERSRQCIVWIQPLSQAVYCLDTAPPPGSVLFGYTPIPQGVYCWGTPFPGTVLLGYTQTRHPTVYCWGTSPSLCIVEPQGRCCINLLYYDDDDYYYYYYPLPRQCAIGVTPPPPGCVSLGYLPSPGSVLLEYPLPDSAAVYCWGIPFGLTVLGYPSLPHAVHRWGNAPAEGNRRTLLRYALPSSVLLGYFPPPPPTHLKAVGVPPLPRL